MQMFQVHHSGGSKATIIIPKIIGISEEVSTENVEYAGEIHERKDVTIILYFGHDMRQKVKSTDKIFKIAWEYRNGKYDRVDKEIKFEEFHDWLIEKLSGEWTK